MFKDVDSKVNFPELEEQLLQFWKDNAIFEKSLKMREEGPMYVFYEGPPTASNLPGLHHALARSFKDLFPRYKTMHGYFVRRRAGWDTHGLPVELEVEKELGLNNKRDIEKYGIAEFNQKCRERVFRYIKEWEQLTERIAFWIDLDDAYITYTNEYVESVWWILKQLWDKDLIYQGFKVVPYCPRCGTPLSDHEVALGYRQTDDPSIYVRFPLRDEPDTYFLVWTTTPWTLPGNVALAVGPDLDYAIVRQNGERLILARDLVEEVIHGDYEITHVVKGTEMLEIRLHYLPLFTFLPTDKDAYYVVAGDFVSTKEGTGIVHIAPAFGAEDMEMGQQYDLPVFQTVNERGEFIDAVTPWRGLFVKQADPHITEELKNRDLLYDSGTYTHTYPFCWRCDSPLLYYARPTWYIETTRVKDRLLANNQKINWVPDHIRDGRFGNWLENNVDWALGRERYWGTPLPVWVCDRCSDKVCIGSVQELEEGAGRPLDDLDLHRPYIDEVVLNCQACGGKMHRVPELIDVWFDSGAMPVAQWHYPFENKELFEEQFPANFICEAVDQTRGWFYTLHAESTLLFDEPCFLNCVSLGLILDEQGEKMSKSKGNVVDPWSVLNVHGADALRWYLYTASQPGESRRFSVNLVGEVVRKFLLTLWNIYSFFVTYANIDQFDPTTSEEVPVPERPALDRWILSELHALERTVDEGLENYDVTGAARPIQAFVDDLSNWYVRRSRRRFWKSEQDADKAAAYQTLYEVLVTLSKLLAPFMPFTSEAMYQNLVRSVVADAPESVHLTDFPTFNPDLIDESLMFDTRLVMRVASLGHAARNKAQIRVRQPLAAAVVQTRTPAERAALKALADQLEEELNVKELRFADGDELVDYEVKPVHAKLGPKYGALLPRLSKALADLPADRVARSVEASEPVEVNVNGQTIQLLPEEIQVETVDKAGYAVAEEGGTVVGIETHLTEVLVREGLAREVVRRIQTLRKDAGFELDDRIRTYYQAGERLASVVVEHTPYITTETLTEDLVEAEPPAGVTSSSFDIDGETIVLGVARRS
ncbi:MAG: isoleucine--tRNA ligase [Anaerolineae bacterium]